MIDWRAAEVKPDVPGVYQVRVLVRDTVTGEPIEVVGRFARWTGKWWCAWALDARTAAMCELPFGPKGGYRWRPSMEHRT
jgi:hypothetical protein